MLSHIAGFLPEAEESPVYVRTRVLSPGSHLTLDGFPRLALVDNIAVNMGVLGPLGFRLQFSRVNTALLNQVVVHI